MKHKRLLNLLDWSAFGSVGLALLLVLFYAPVETTMGVVQKLFYFHLSSAWVGMLAFLIAVAASILYLQKRVMSHDRIAKSSIEIGLLFTLMTIVSGMIWAKPTWNTWWTWDPRLTTVTVMGLIYAAYFQFRRQVDNQERRAKFASIYAIFGFITVPMTFFSARLLRSIHPIVIGSGGAESSLESKMVVVLVFSLMAFSLLYVDLLLHRIGLDELLETECSSNAHESKE